MQQSTTQTILQALERQQRAGGELVRHRETRARTFALAARLRAGLDPEHPVCLATMDRALIAAALLAALAGGAPLLLPFSLTPAVLADIGRLGNSNAILGRDAPALPRHARPISLASLPMPPGPNRLAWAPERQILTICTGGTTGRPQSWTKTGANLFLEACFLAQWLGVTAADHIVATVPPCHIYGLLFSVLLPLVSGATVSAATPSFPGEILRTAHEEGATILVSVPAHYRALRGSDDRLRPSALRLAISSAGMLDAHDHAAFTERYAIDLVEVYGSTETGGIASRNRRHQDAFTAFPAIDWKIIDQRLALRSPYLSPDAPLDRDGYFLCGDRVARQGTRHFTLLGRIDNITKVGGKRVDLDALRSLIMDLDRVTDCVVLARRTRQGRENQILALVQGSADASEIRRSLAGRVEPYALPRHIRVVDSLPMQKNGKIDREAVLGHFAR